MFVSNLHTGKMSRKKLGIWAMFTHRRSSHRRCSVRKGVLTRNFGKFTGKHLCQSLLFNKVAGVKPATLIKRDSDTGFFSVNFAKFLRTPIFPEHFHATASYRSLLVFSNTTKKVNPIFMKHGFLLPIVHIQSVWK